ncbi:MAG: crossover junction endodeoxyribonuclease RuvC [Phycisphaerae bacterium]|nr:crossover junction endodeoxyribonuclease RuvC [Phycisphaerae bacterium]
MRILGIDPGLRCTGYGCLDVETSGVAATLVEAGVFRIDARLPLPTRLSTLHSDLDATIEDLSPDCIVVESLFARYQRARTAIMMGHARGVILQAAGARSIQVLDFTATAVKKAVTGNGHATKLQVQEAVRCHLGLLERPEPHDVSDAIAVALCASWRMDQPSELAPSSLPEAG